MGTNLYVGNLPKDASKSKLRDLFGADGRTVTRVDIVTDKEGRPRGFAFVELSTEEEAEKAREALDGYKLGGQAIVVNEARATSEGGGGKGRDAAGGRKDRGQAGPPGKGLASGERKGKGFTGAGGRRGGGSSGGRR